MLRWAVIISFLLIVPLLLALFWAVLRLILQIDRINTNARLLNQLLTRIPADAVQRALDPPKDPPLTTGMDFGVGQMFLRLMGRSE